MNCEVQVAADAALRDRRPRLRASLGLSSTPATSARELSHDTTPKTTDLVLDEVKA